MIPISAEKATSFQANMEGTHDSQVYESANQTNESGGFLLPSRPSPPHESQSTSWSRGHGLIRNARPLPTPRPSPLRPGSKHETALIRFLDQGLLDVSRKYTKKYTPGGYNDIYSIIKDLEKLIDLIWISATRKFAPLLSIATQC